MTISSVVYCGAAGGFDADGAVNSTRPKRTTWVLGCTTKLLFILVWVFQGNLQYYILWRGGGPLLSFSRYIYFIFWLLLVGLVCKVPIKKGQKLTLAFPFLSLYPTYTHTQLYILPLISPTNHPLVNVFLLNWAQGLLCRVSCWLLFDHHMCILFINTQRRILQKWKKKKTSQMFISLFLACDQQFMTVKRERKKEIGERLATWLW